MEVIQALMTALESQRALGERLTGSDLSRSTRCPGWSVFDVMNHSIGVTAKFAEFAAGATDRPRTPGGDLIGGRLEPALRWTADQARAAWSAADLSRECHLPFGDVSSETAAGINLIDVLAHGWDVSFGDIAFTCPDEVWATALDVARRFIGPGRDPLQYGPEVVVPESAPDEHRFLGYLGREQPGGWIDGPSPMGPRPRGR